MGGALDKGILKIKKNVRLPIQANAGMRATVFVNKKLVVSIDDKYIQRFTIETFAVHLKPKKIPWLFRELNRKLK